MGKFEKVKTRKKQNRIKSLQKKLARVRIKNLPTKITDDEIKSLFSKYGKVLKIQLQRKPNGDVAGCGFVQFSNQKQAVKAVEDTNGNVIYDKKIQVEQAFTKLAGNSVDHPVVKTEPFDDDYEMERNSYTQDKGSTKKKGEGKNKINSKESRNKLEKINNDNSQIFTDSLKEEPYDYEDTDDIKIENDSYGSVLPHEGGDIHRYSKEQFPKDNNVEQKDREKKLRNSKSQKRSRLIVRNLPFKITEEGLRDHFSKYGEISEINLLRKPDGKLVGCAFIQFTWKQNAAKAIHCTSGKPLLGRIIIVDWAVSKSQYTTHEEEKEDDAIEGEDVHVKSEPDDNESFEAGDVKVKEEQNSSDDDESGHISNSNNKTEYNRKVDDDDESSVEDDAQDDKNDSDTDASSDDGDDHSDESSEDEPEKLNMSKQQNTLPSDINQGCTVFVKKIPFSATNDDLRKCMEKFGSITYALICMDPLTEHSKGSGFVKFKEKESADRCLEWSEELIINDQVVEVCRALNKNDLENKLKNSKNVNNRDSRNLYLVKEGVILAGSKAAEGVSATDMAKRLQLEQYKTQMLRNLNMYVSRVRLVVHNIPASWDNAKLHSLFSSHSEPDAVIKEARIMRNMRQVDANGIGKSKEYGFVTFTNHESALNALRKINNNPSIFTEKKRPIVSFSIENRAIRNLRQRRLEKSRMKNPLFNSENASVSEASKQAHRNKDRFKRKNPNEYDDPNEYTGVTAKPGKTKLRSRFNLKTQANIHNSVLKKNRAKERRHKRMIFEKQIKREKIKDSRHNKKLRKPAVDDDHTFTKLVNKYKTSLLSVPAKKWYE